MTLLSKWQGELQNANDLTRKFMDTYVKARVNGEEGVWYISAFRDDRGVSITPVVRKEANGAPYFGIGVWVLLKDVDIIAPVPEQGIYQHDSRILVVLRNPMRQWLEGFHPHTCTVLLNGSKNLVRFDKGLVLNVFAKQENLSVERALAKIQRNHSIRLNSRYWMQQEGSSVSIYRMRACLGSFEVGKFFWSHKGKMFQEEVKDELGFYA